MPKVFVHGNPEASALWRVLFDELRPLPLESPQRSEARRVRRPVIGLALAAKGPRQDRAPALPHQTRGTMLLPTGLRPRSASPAGRRRRSRRTLALALEGQLDDALRHFNALVRAAPNPEAISNRGAVRAARGNLRGAQLDLAAGAERKPELTVAWLNLARVVEAQGLPVEARDAFTRAVQQACRPPHGIPHATGGAGLALGSGLLLLWDDTGLALALPDFYRTACSTLRSQESRLASSRSAASRNSS